MTSNLAMEQLLARCDAEKAVLLPALKAILDEGLLWREGCLLLNSQSKLVSSEARDQLTDRTGFECFVNHLHIEDYVQGTGCTLVEQAIAFGRELQAATRRIGVKEQLIYIVAGDCEEMNVRFHILRPGEQWVSPDLEQYEEAVGVQLL
jgi:hypothetical protein